jgi:hypothetical protein
VREVEVGGWWSEAGPGQKVQDSLVQRLKPLILAIQEAEIGRTVVQGHSR